MEKHRTAIVLAAGQGKRMGTDVQKQFLKLGAYPVLYYSLAALEAWKPLADIVLVTGQEEAAYCQKEIVEKYRLRKVRRIVPGGKERYDSVYEGLKACENADEVYIHDGARPFLDEGILNRMKETLESYRACAAGMPSKDTVKLAGKDGCILETPKRERVWNIQTPQGFSYALIWEAHRLARRKSMEGITDDAMLVERELEEPVKLVEGSYENIKITTPEDLALAELILQRRRENAGRCRM